ncbi:hypothetical protein F4819DRAFT_507860 [Hypoxylon fuscum]|nr:hypothetical protein F4819DRAFT_507860 [Hypoxylon fuscum]
MDTRGSKRKLSSSSESEDSVRPSKVLLQYMDLPVPTVEEEDARAAASQPAREAPPIHDAPELSVSDVSSDESDSLFFEDESKAAVAAPHEETIKTNPGIKTEERDFGAPARKVDLDLLADDLFPHRAINNRLPSLEVPGFNADQTRRPVLHDDEILSSSDEDLYPDRPAPERPAAGYPISYSSGSERDTSTLTDSEPEGEGEAAPKPAPQNQAQDQAQDQALPRDAEAVMAGLDTHGLLRHVARVVNFVARATGAEIDLADLPTVRDVLSVRLQRVRGDFDWDTPADDAADNAEAVVDELVGMSVGEYLVLARTAVQFAEDLKDHGVVLPERDV